MTEEPTWEQLNTSPDHSLQLTDKFDGQEVTGLSETALMSSETGDLLPSGAKVVAPVGKLTPARPTEIGSGVLGGFFGTPLGAQIIELVGEIFNMTDLEAGQTVTAAVGFMAGTITWFVSKRMEGRFQFPWTRPKRGKK